METAKIEAAAGILMFPPYMLRMNFKEKIKPKVAVIELELFAQI